MSTALTITYTPTATTSGADIRLTLAQEPVDKRSGLLQADLDRMLALVLSGQSARRYKPARCAAWIRETVVGADLVVHAWPVPEDLDYTLEAVGCEAAEPARVQVEGEFDLVVPMSASVDLPASFAGLTYTWQTPCFNRFGEEVPAPAITVHPARLELAAEVFGVLRIAGQAIGDRYAITYTVPKMQSGQVLKYEDLPEAAVIARWTDADGEPANAQLALDLPGCLEQLLEACPDGSLVADRKAGGQINPDEGLVPVVYYSACTGNVLALRYEAV
ncbi:MAG: hypothetical protein M0P26_02585 [Bacteroidales bacterium]|nr:hypothetical protein [Bacteroidales bacterium]